MAAKKVRYIGKHAPRFVQHAVHGTIVFPAGEPVSVPADLAESLVRQTDRFELVTEPATKSPAKKAASKKADNAAATDDPQEG